RVTRGVVGQCALNFPRDRLARDALHDETAAESVLRCQYAANDRRAYARSDCCLNCCGFGRELRDVVGLRVAGRTTTQDQWQHTCATHRIERPRLHARACGELS